MVVGVGGDLMKLGRCKESLWNSEIGEREMFRGFSGVHKKLVLVINVW